MNDYKAVIKSGILPIESNPELLVEYGRAFARINTLEYLLEELIIVKGGLGSVKKDLREKLVNKKMLGQKIELAATLLEPTLISKLRSLNDKRILLAHNATAQEINNSGDEQKPGNYVIGIGEKQEILTNKFLSDISNLAQELLVDFHAAFLKGTKFELK